MGKYLKLIWEYISKGLKWIWEKIKDFFSFIFSDWRSFVIFLLTLIVIVLMCKYCSLNREYDAINLASTEKITEYENKLGEIYQERKILIQDIDELKKTNTELYNEAKSLKDDPIVITKVDTRVVYKDLVIHDTVLEIGDDEYMTSINYKDDWCLINGRTIIDIRDSASVTTFDSISFGNNLTMDVIDKSGDLSLIVKSDNPYCRINNVNGVILSPEQSKALKKRFDKKWCFTIGVGGTVGYYDGKAVVVPGVSLIFGYKIWGF